MNMKRLLCLVCAFMLLFCMTAHADYSDSIEEIYNSYRDINEDADSINLQLVNGAYRTFEMRFVLASILDRDSAYADYLASVHDNYKAIDEDAEASDKDQDLLTTLEVVYEFYLRGFDFLPIDIYKSHATRFEVEDGKLRPPFVAISGLGESAAFDIMEGREGKRFLSVEDFSAACPKVSKTHIQMLKDAGAFGDLPDTSQVSLF